MRLLALVSLLPLVVAVSSCSSSAVSAPDAPDTWRASEALSGSRLRAQFLTAGEARAHVGFHDGQRNEDCTFQAAEDGRIRCLPATVSYLKGSTFFADAACTTQVEVVTPAPTCSDAKYAIGSTYDGSNCAPVPPELRRILAPATVFQNQGAGCVPVAAPVVPVGDIVPWTDFVAATTSTEAGVTDALKESLLIADDGATQHEGFHSVALDEPCAFELMADGIARCVPAGQPAQIFFKDATCASPSMVVLNSGGGCKRVPERVLVPATSTEGSACNQIQGVYTLRDYTVSDAGDLYNYTPGGGPSSAASCTSIAPFSDGYGQLRRSLDVDLTPTLPVATRVSGRSGRLVPALVAKGDTRALTPGWHDNDLGADCTFKVASDGKTRCLPTVAEFRLFFADDSCNSKTPIAAPATPRCGGTNSSFALVASTTCPVTMRVFSVGTIQRDLQSASTETAPGRCVKVSGLNGAYDATEVEPTKFVEATLVTE